MALTLPAATPSVWFPTGESLHVAVRRAGRAEPILDTTFVIADSLRAEFPVPMSQALESFVATAEVLYAGSLYFLAFEALRIRAGADTAIVLDATYVGPGARAASYALSLRDSTLRRGDTTSLVPLVLDSSGQRIENVPARYVSRRPAIVAVGPTGVLSVQPVPPDTARVTGYLPSGLRDSLVVRVRSRADSLAMVSGNNQTGARLYALGTAVTVLVLGDDGNPVAGEPVQFAADSGDGSFAPGTVLTDAAGRAASGWTLGGRVATQGGTVTVEGVQPLRVAATALALPPDSVFVSPATATLTWLGATRQLAAAVYDSTGAAIAGKTFTWASADTGVVQVDSTGLARAVGDGATTISASADGVVGSAALTVARVVAEVTVSPAASILPTIGATQQFTAAAFDSAVASITGKSFTWSSSAPGVATVDTLGLATAVSSGVTTITATADGVADSAELTVSIGPTTATEEIVFISTRDGNREVYVMEADGSGARRITNSPEDEYRPAWAPGRSALVFERDLSGTRQIFRIGAGGSGEVQLTVDGENTRPRFSPDGTRMAFTSTRNGMPEVWVMAAGGSDQRRLVDPGSGSLGNYFGDWSPDGTRIVFVWYGCTEDGCGSELAFTDSSGARIGDLGIYGSNPSVGHAVRWSPQGWRLAMTAEPSGGDTTLGSAGPDYSVRVMPDHSVTFDANAAYAGDWDRFVWESEDSGVHGIYGGQYGSSGLRLSPNGIGEFEPDHIPPAQPSYLVAVAIAGDTLTPINPGETRQLTRLGYDQNGVTIIPENGFQWYVNGVYPDYSVARVDTNGLVTGSAGGRALVIAQYLYGMFGDSVHVTVTHAPGTWAPGGLMDQGRWAHAGALLGDGRALITGGIVGYCAPGCEIIGSSTELYDPATGTSTASGGMRAFRKEHTATVLNDGRMLLVAGRYGGLVREVQRTAELYDPATGTTAYTDSLGKSDLVCCTGRRWHTATKLNDGRVLVAGGGGATSSNQSYALRQSELYDPGAGTFTPTGLMTIPRQTHTATLLPDGKVLIVGGIGSSFQWGSLSAEIYDPGTGTFTLADSLAVERREHAAVALADGRVLVTGGYNYSSGTFFASAEIYDPATGQFAPTGNMTTGRWRHTATLLPNGQVLITGGNTADLYDPVSGTFTATGAMFQSRNYHLAVLLPSGLVAVFGATSGNLNPSIELYRP